MSESAAGTIETALEDGVFRITIANPARFNALSISMWEELARAAETASADDGVRVVVVRGQGSKAFAAGADISEFGTHQQDPVQLARFDAATRSAMRALRVCRHPTAAVIRGVCFGGGMSLAIACDLRWCNDGARFRMPAGRLGLGYDPTGIERFAHVLGAAGTADLFYTGRVLDGHEAERMGLVQQSFADDVFDLVVEERIAGIRNMAPLTVRAAKLALRQALRESDAPAGDAVESAFLQCFHSTDYLEGQAAFREKREPRFMGA